MQIMFHIPEFGRKERNLHCDVVHFTTVWVTRPQLLYEQLRHMDTRHFVILECRHHLAKEKCQSRKLIICCHRLSDRNFGCRQQPDQDT